ncbi:sugar kinase [Helcococcus kunzii]|uniref:sugar kinase n=1 Tax=Helcococcus kunzii TaxID=40091 RepID=UPI0024ADA1BE|nr:sugar kinase [Helcococcus kunzii]
MANILTIGEAMGLFVSKEEGPLKSVKEFRRLVSGAEINVSIGVTRLGHKAYYFTQLGKDPIGDNIIEFLKSENININNIMQVKDYNTGIQLKGKTKEGDPEIAYYRKNSAASQMTLDNIKSIDFSDIDLLHITGIFMGLNNQTYEIVYNLVKKAKENNIIVTFDPNIRESLWESREIMIERINAIGCMCDYILPGQNEGEILTGFRNVDEIAKFYLDYGVKNVIIKLGEKGSAFFIKEKGEIKTTSHPGFKVDKIIDTVGAGDGFASGVITGILDNLSDYDILERANAIGAIQITHQSDNEGLPTIDELKEFIKNR